MYVVQGYYFETKKHNVIIRTLRVGKVYKFFQDFGCTVIVNVTPS